jgi:hypothetical protein
MAEKENMPKKVSPIEAIEKQSETMITLAKADLDTYFDKKYVEQVKEQYGSLEITSLKDIKGYEAMKDTAKQVRTMRIDLDNRRKELTKPATNYQKDLISHAKPNIELAEQTESLLKERLQAIEDLQEAEKNKLTKERSELLMNNGYELIGKLYVCGIVQVDAETIGDLSEEDIEHYVNMGKQEIQRREAEEQRKKEEQERLKKEREEIEAEKAKIRKEKQEYEEFLKWKKSQEKPEEPEPKPEEPKSQEKPDPAKKPESKSEGKQPSEPTKPLAPQKKQLTPEQKAFRDAKGAIYKKIDEVIVGHLESKTDKITLKTVRHHVDQVKEFIVDLQPSK